MECDVSGPHRNLSGNIPITLGTIPLASFKAPAPYTDVPAQVPPQHFQQDDPSMAPTQPVSPASPPNGTGGALGWNVADSAGAQLYPNIRKYCQEIFVKRNKESSTIFMYLTFSAATIC